MEVIGLKTRSRRPMLQETRWVTKAFEKKNTRTNLKVVKPVKVIEPVIFYDPRFRGSPSQGVVLFKNLKSIVHLTF